MFFFLIIYFTAIFLWRISLLNNFTVRLHYEKSGISYTSNRSLLFLSVMLNTKLSTISKPFSLTDTVRIRRERSVDYRRKWRGEGGSRLAAKGPHDLISDNHSLSRQKFPDNGQSVSKRKGNLSIVFWARLVGTPDFGRNLITKEKLLITIVLSYIQSKSGTFKTYPLFYLDRQ